MNIKGFIIAVVLTTIISFFIAGAALALKDAHIINSSQALLTKQITIDHHYGLVSSDILSQINKKPDSYFNNHQFQRKEFNQLYKNVFDVPIVFLVFESATPTSPLFKRSNDYQLFNLVQYIQTKQAIFKELETSATPVGTQTPTSDEERFNDILKEILSVNTLETVYLVPIDDSVDVSGKTNRNVFIAMIIIGVFTLFLMLYFLYKAITDDDEGGYDELY